MSDEETNDLVCASMRHPSASLATGNDDEEQQDERVGIEKISDDCLSLIFEAIAKMDWLMPYSLQCVCRRWYSVLCHTPLAWSSSYIWWPVDSTEVYAKICAKTKGVPLHLRGSFIDDPQTLLTAGHRICCLSVDGILPNLPVDALFPLLCRLRTVPPIGSLPRFLNEHIFPAILHLDLTITQTNPDLNLSLPRLESCRLRMCFDGGWEPLTQSCTSSLIYLRLVWLQGRPFGNGVEMVLPRLRHLALVDLSLSDPRLSNTYTTFRTPSLESYEQSIGGRHGHPYKLLHTDVGGVTQMKTNKPLPLTTFRSLELVIVHSMGDATEMLKDPGSDVLPDAKLRDLMNSQFYDQHKHIIFKESGGESDNFGVINDYGKCDYSACG